MISFKEFLIELFDKPWKLEDHSKTPNGQLFKNHIKSITGTHIGFKFFKAEGDNGHVLEYAHNGAIEIHHLDKDFVSGEKPVIPSNKPNPRFIATMKNRIENHVEHNRHRVRVVAPDNLINNYHRIAHSLAKKNGYHVTVPMPHEHPFGNREETYKSFYIRPKNSVIPEELATRANLNSKTQQSFDRVLGLIKEFYDD